MPNQTPKLFFFVPNDAYFYSHRLPMAFAAQEAGYDVGVITAGTSKKEEIEKKGIKVLSLPISPGIKNPFKELKTIYDLTQILRKENPHILHNVTLKAITYGGIASFFSRVPYIINAIAGLGYIFNSSQPKAKLLRTIITPIFSILLKRKNSTLLLQNKDDKALLISKRMAIEENSMIISGSGVELEKYIPTPLPKTDDQIVCTFSGRMIGIKGLATLKAAFEILKEKAPHIRLQLCGVPDANNPGSWTEDHLKEWSKKPNVEWLGFCRDMPEIWSKSHIALQVSDGGEGIPKSLLEAAACGRAIIATDVPGCREIVAHEKNGLLLPPKNPEMLAEALITLSRDNKKLAAFSDYSPQLIKDRKLSAEDVKQQIKQLYEELKC